ncbi:hypothetical protein N7540_011095 [Penicillium herquei]|nr:hypothetical protein N7540_011095 [Penicillium herquei]
MTPTKKPSDDENPFAMKTLRKKISTHLTGRTTPLSRTTTENTNSELVQVQAEEAVSEVSSKSKATKVQMIDFQDTKTEFLMEVDENGENIIHWYDAFSVMELEGAEEVIQKFHSHILPKGGLQRRIWRIEPGHKVTLRMTAGVEAPIFMERGIDGNLLISTAPGTSWTQDADLKIGDGG